VSEWVNLGGDRRPAAEAVGPFPHRPFLETWWEHRGEGALSVVDCGTSAAAFIEVGGTLSFAGDPDVTDYHSPLGDQPGMAVAAAIAGAPSGTTVVLDSMPEEVARPVMAAAVAAGIEPVVREHEATMVLDLSGDAAATMSGKQRHEMRRKERRFVEAVGEPGLITGPAGFDLFVAMHRMSEGPKGGFMSAANESFLRDLLGVAGSLVDVLVTGEGDPVAAAFGFADSDAYYLYNSSFDPRAEAISPGMVLLQMLIERESSVGRHRFDFLKGTEEYKRRLGALPRALFQIEGVV
jgi:CelD/BcsL family acetyltransferase involved in cellulose biosynthesis